MNRNSACLWLPCIEAAGLPTPETVMIPYCHRDCLSIFDGEPSPEFDRLRVAIEAAMDFVGSPAFIRTDLSSAKHSGPKAYLVDRDPKNTAVLRTLEDSEMKFWLSDYPEAFMVRKFLKLDASFTAFGGLPIAREWRFFANSDRVLCWHFYWPAEAIEEHVTDPGWREVLRDHHTEPSEIETLKQMAVEAVHAIGGGEWSVDFAKDTEGKWWLLDCATAQDSYHWPGCQKTA